MMRFHPAGRLVLALSLVLSPCGAQSLDSVFARMDKAARQFKGVSASIRQLVHVAAVNDDSYDNGTMKLKREKADDTRILVEFTTPNQKSVSIGGGEVRLYMPKARVVQVYDLRNKRATVEQGLLLGFGADSSEIRAAYEVTYIGAEKVEGQAASHIRLIPRSKEVLQSIKQADLWILDSLGCPVQQRMTTSNGGDYTQITYSALKMNPSLSEKDLKLNVPKGVQIQQVGK